MRQLVDTLDETANLSVRAGVTCRFLLSVAGSQTLRVSNREGMVFPAHGAGTGTAVAAVSLSMSSVRYQPERVGFIVTALEATSRAISRTLGNSAA
jgi:DNA-binding IclR family transcriptional regulator